MATTFTGWNGWDGRGVRPGGVWAGSRGFRERVESGGSRWSYPLGIAREGMGATDNCRRPMPDHFLRFGSFGAVGSWAAWGFGCVSCVFSGCLGLTVTDSMRNGRMPTLRALICQVSRG